MRSLRSNERLPQRPGSTEKIKYDTDADLRSLRSKERHPDDKTRPESPQRAPEGSPGGDQMRQKQHRFMRWYKMAAQRVCAQPAQKRDAPRLTTTKKTICALIVLPRRDERKRIK